jgi:hypothetical protein
MSEFKVGDKVHSQFYGKGVVVRCVRQNVSPGFELKVLFGGMGLRYFYLDGRRYEVPDKKSDLVKVEEATQRDFIKELAEKYPDEDLNEVKRLLATDVGFKRAAEELAQKLAHALLNAEYGTIVWRREKQSPTLFLAAGLRVSEEVPRLRAGGDFVALA